MDLLGSSRNLFKKLLHVERIAMVKPKTTIRRFKQDDAKAVSALICRCLHEVNKKDYPEEEIERVCQVYQPGHLLDINQKAHVYIADYDRQPVGCAAIQKIDDFTCKITAVFVRPDLHGQHIGQALMAELEQDSITEQGQTLTLDASATALGFYLNLGYQYTKDTAQPDRHGLYSLYKLI